MRCCTGEYKRAARRERRSAPRLCYGRSSRPEPFALLPRRPPPTETPRPRSGTPRSPPVLTACRGAALRSGRTGSAEPPRRSGAPRGASCSGNGSAAAALSGAGAFCSRGAALLVPRPPRAGLGSPVPLCGRRPRRVPAPGPPPPGPGARSAPAAALCLRFPARSDSARRGRGPRPDLRLSPGPGAPPRAVPAAAPPSPAAPIPAGATAALPPSPSSPARTAPARSLSLLLRPRAVSAARLGSRHPRAPLPLTEPLGSEALRCPTPRAAPALPPLHPRPPAGPDPSTSIPARGYGGSRQDGELSQRQAAAQLTDQGKAETPVLHSLLFLLILLSLSKILPCTS